MVSVLASSGVDLGFRSLLSQAKGYLNKFKWIFILQVFFKETINISVKPVSESYVLLYYEKKVYILFINKICLNQTKWYKNGICCFSAKRIAIKA